MTAPIVPLHEMEALLAKYVPEVLFEYDDQETGERVPVTRAHLAAVLVEREAAVVQAAKAEALRDAAAHLAAEGWRLTHMPSDGVRRRVYAQIVNQLRGWASGGLPVKKPPRSRTAPSTEGSD